MADFQFESLDGWENFVDIPEAFVYLVYSVAKLILVVTIISNIVRSCCCKHKCRTKSCNDRRFFNCFWKYFMIIVVEIVEMVFGKPIGVVKRRNNEHNEREHNREHKIQTLYIHQKQINYTDTLTLAVVSLSLALMLFTTFWDRFWLKVSDECILDPTTHCYPIQVPSESTVNLNISTHSKITNCSKWEALKNKGLIEFRCFQVVYDLSVALEATGGLITIFGISAMIGAKALIFLTECLLNENCKCCKNTWNCIIKYCCFCQCIMQQYTKEQLWIIRVIVATLLSAADLSAGSFAAAVYIGDLFEINVLHNVFKGNTDAATNVFHNLNKLILPLGILSTTLFLPFENYIVHFTTDLSKNDDQITILSQQEENGSKENMRMNSTKYGAIGFTPTSDITGVHTTTI